MRGSRLQSLLFALSGQINALQPTSHLPSTPIQPDAISRRSVLITPATAIITTIALPTPSFAAISNGLTLTTAPTSGLKYAEAKIGTGQPLQRGSIASIDYSMASTAGRFPQIYTTKDKGTPYRWTLGDGTTIQGIELAILGNVEDGVPPLLPGGIRRVIIPARLGYEALVKGGTVINAGVTCVDGGKGSVGPIPPKDESGAYQRWAQFYCNPRIPYQPDLVFDIKLYGKRTKQ